MAPEIQTILCCDDEEVLVDVLSEELEFHGYRTLKALSGNQAISMLENHHVDLIVSDMRMPDGDGLKVLRYLKNSPHLQNIPLIFLTAHSPTPIPELLKQGASAVINKPMDLDELMSQLHKSLPEIISK